MGRLQNSSVMEVILPRQEVGMRRDELGKSRDEFGKRRDEFGKSKYGWMGGWAGQSQSLNLHQIFPAYNECGWVGEVVWDP